jgi:2-polyprenyl-3-methyl-5-hydroxy-6-metoxy-1,4-benzoquinol methylase
MKEAVIIDDFRCYAPELALDCDDYPVESYQRLCQLEEVHFWFRARNRIIIREFGRHLPSHGRPRILEIGCGTGNVLQSLAALNRYDLTGAEAHIAGLRLARARLPMVEFVQADARDLPYEATFDAIGAFDVIEHITEDEGVLVSVWRSLKPRGIVVVTVPQHQWLWSSVDEQARHKRRYRRRDLLVKMRSAGFEVLRVTSFITALLPVLYASRLSKRQRPDAASEIDWSEFELSPFANATGEAATRIDEALIGAGLSLPLGGSLLAVGRKRTQA